MTAITEGLVFGLATATKCCDFAAIFLGAISELNVYVSIYEQRTIWDYFDLSWTLAK